MTATINENERTREAFEELLLLAKCEYENDRRATKRYPFFRAATMDVGSQRFPAFIREVSSTGLGLLHGREVPLGEIKLTIASRRGPLHVCIQRCEPIGAGWYISGGDLMGQAD